MDVLDIARWQFGIITVYHFLFVPLTIGLTLLIALLETQWLRTRNEDYPGFGAEIHAHNVFEMLGYAAGSQAYWLSRRRAKGPKLSVENTLYLITAAAVGARIQRSWSAPAAE